ncbi:hypothetical protein GWI33_019603 [Rhynchophorus ferrugineus]|uniref:Uncharacterized protein n=1 Tax=Rhynchophorus ferrugineus TaxID=354439 RepID=A0A834M423_RHYFE|nr:hypothetical protein GWI33_019603 [Rhynchophorus ferrugineus]
MAVVADNQSPSFLCPVTFYLERFPKRIFLKRVNMYFHYIKTTEDILSAMHLVKTPKLLALLHNKHSSLHKDGSKSAGATPISVRRSSLRPNYRAQEECLKKRSNSVSFHRDSTVLIDKRDREADMKYKELIGQAEQIIRTMNINGLSPRRIPGPTNKRVELLRTTECGKPEALFKNKPTEETLVINSNIAPSNNLFKNNRFSPKKNHITNFIINNSPVLVRKELQGQSPLTMRRNLTEDHNYSPIVNRKQKQIHEDIYKKPSDNLTIIKKTMREHHEVSFESPVNMRKSYQPKSILHKSECNHMGILSPRHRRPLEPAIGSSSSDEEACHRSRKKLSRSCPQSEPMRRKVYFGRSTIGFSKGHEKTVAFNLTNEMPNLSLENNVGSSDNLRHQVLLNTIQSLKRNLEDQSASLQQSYRNMHHMYKY